MELQELEKFVFYKGVLGCSLNVVPKELLEQIPHANHLEIVEKDVCQAYPISINDSSYNNVKTYKIDELNNYEDYWIRPKSESWKKIVYNGRNLYSGNINSFVSLAMQHPEGIVRSTLKGKLPNFDSKSYSKFMKMLEEMNVMHKKLNEENQEIIVFNREIIENQQRCEPEPKRIPKTGETNGKSQKAKPRYAPKIDEVDDQMIEKAKEAINDHPNGMPLKSLKMFLNVSDGVVNGVAEKFRSMENYNVVKKPNSSTKIIYTGLMKLDYADKEAVESLVDMCKSLKIILISEQPRELRNLKAAMGINDEKLIEILDDSGFKIIEIRCKYINSDFLLFSSEVDEHDSSLLELFEKAKSKIARYFRLKVQRTFLANNSLVPLDNNYSPSLNERIAYFYKYIVQQMKKNKMFFYFTAESLMDMDFFTFIRLVPLRTEFHFVETMAAVTKENGKKGISRKTLETMSVNEYEDLNSRLLDIAKSYTVQDILSALPDECDAKKNLLNRIQVLEFDKILLSLVKYNIFEGFSDAKYIYFEEIEGIENYIDKILQTIKEDPADSNLHISYPHRREFYDQISELSPDEFCSKTRELIDSCSDGPKKEFFMKKLQLFE